MTISLLLKTPHQTIKLVDTAGVPVRVAPLQDYMSSRITIWARKGWNSDAPNVGTVYLGWNQAGQPIELAPLDSIDIWAPPSVGYDIWSLWLRVATPGDGIVYAIYP